MAFPYRIVAESGEKASHAADGDTNRERNRVKISSGLLDACVALHKFNRHKPEHQSTNNGLTAGEIRGTVQVLKRKPWVLEQKQQLGPDRGAAKSCGNNDPTCWS